MTKFKLTLLATVATGFMMVSSPASANDMIHNAAVGQVDGDVFQIQNDGNGSLDLQVGSIRAEQASNNQVQASVHGDVTQSTLGADVSASVGALDATQSHHNQAAGLINGDLTQNGGKKGSIRATIGSMGPQ